MADNWDIPKSIPQWLARQLAVMNERIKMYEELHLPETNMNIRLLAEAKVDGKPAPQPIPGIPRGADNA